MTSYGLKPKWPKLPFVGLDILSKFRFLSHNFRSRNARKLIKAFKDSKDSLVSDKNLN